MDNKTKPITEKYALDYYRRSRPTRAWKYAWNIAAVALAAATVAGIYLVERDEAFHAAPVSSAHSVFGDRCELCHDRVGQTARRLITFSGEVRSVSDRACQACHRAAEHQTGLVAGPVCVACHQEHRPDRRLSHVMDSNCIECHRQLELDDGAAVSFAAQIERFNAGGRAHPEFALLRASDEDVGPRHGAQSVAVFAAEEASGGTWLDRGGLRFNHKMHLDPAGVMHPDRTKRTLTCAACHLPDADGRYMRPIEYEQHCADCHPLRLTGPLSRVGEIPHSSVEEVRGILRERLSRLRLESQRAASPAPSARPESTRQLSLLPVPAVLSEADEQKIGALMITADHAVFGMEAKGMCRHCHHVETRDGQWHVPMSVVRGSPDPALRASGSVGRPATTRPATTRPATTRPATARPAATMNQMVPDRWFEHAKFDHQRHRAIQCGDCHAADHSSATADILLPSIAVCRSCHGGAAGASSSRVSAECILCHTYHDESHGAPGVPLQQLLSGMPLETAPSTSP